MGKGAFAPFTQILEKIGFKPCRKKKVKWIHFEIRQTAQVLF